MRAINLFRPLLLALVGQLVDHLRLFVLVVVERLALEWARDFGLRKALPEVGLVSSAHRRLVYALWFLEVLLVQVDRLRLLHLDWL